MKIQSLLAEAGRPVISNHEVSDDPNSRELTDLINKLGAGIALEEVRADTNKLLYRGLRNTGGHLVIQQDTLSSTRSSENTGNYVTWFTEILPSWHRAGLLPRSKIVSCTSSVRKAAEYGQRFVVLPTDGAQCVYTGSHDFWNAFEGINHLYGVPDSIPAINDAFSKYLPRVLSNSDGLKRACTELQDALESGRIREEDLNKEMQALLNSEDTYDVFAIVDNLMDPSHMRKAQGGHLLVPGDFDNIGEEVQVGGEIVYVEYNTFMNAFFPPRA